jgi:hypothetical protein
MKRKLLKSLKIVGGTILFLIILAISLPFVFKDKLVRIAKEQINQQLHATVDFGKVSLSLFRSFPDMTMSLKELTIDGIDTFEKVRLLNVKEVNLNLNLLSVFNGGQIEIHTFNMVNPQVQFLVREDGTYNWDIFKETEVDSITIEKTESFDLAAIKKYTITNGEISYADYESNIFLLMDDVHHRGSGDFKSDAFIMETQTEAKSLSFRLGTIDYIKQAIVSATINVDMQMSDLKFTFTDSHFQLNQLKMDVNGGIALKDEAIDMNIAFDAGRSEFKSLLSLIPSLYSRNFDGLTANGDLVAKGIIKGTYDPVENLMPGFDIQLKVDNGSFRYVDLPAGVDRVNFDMKLQSDGMRAYDDLIVAVSQASLRIADNPIQASLSLRTPLSDPDIQCEVKGRLDLNSLKMVFPLEESEVYTGIIDLNLDLAGRLSAIERKQYNLFKAEGRGSVTNLNISSGSFELPLKVDKANFNVTPAHIKVDQVNMEIGTSDLRISGFIDNYLEYFFQDTWLKGRFDVSTSKLNLNEWMKYAPESDQPESTTAGVIDLPGNIDFYLKAIADEVLYDHFMLTNVKGEVRIFDKKASLANLDFGLFGGQWGLNGTYDVNNINRPQVDFDFNIKQLDIRQAATHITSLGLMAPIASRTTGLLSTGLSFKGALHSDMSLDLMSIGGKGRLASNNLFIEGFEPLNELASRLNISRLAKQKIDDVKIFFRISEGRMDVDPYEVMLGNIQSTIAGYTTLEQDIFYLMNLKIPRSEFGNKSNQIFDQLLSEGRKRGLKVDEMPFLFAEVQIEGKILAPRLTFKLGDETKNLAQSLQQQLEGLVKDKIEEVKSIVDDKISEAKQIADDKINEARLKAQAELDQRADDLLKEAETTAAKWREEARQAANRVRQEGEEQAKRLESENTNPLRQAASKIAADKIRNESNRNADRVEQEANQRIDQLLRDTKLRADAIRKGE